MYNMVCVWALQRFTEKHLGLRAHFYHFLPTTKTLESPSE